jgi:tetratricopeptide (TPR) repeat protein
LQALKEDQSWILNRQGLFKASQGNFKEAIKDFERACQLNPFNDKALSNLACTHNNLGVILANKKDYDEALRHFNAAKAQKPEDISIRLNLLSTLVTLKDATAIEKEAGEIIRLRPTDVETVLKVAAAFQNSENSLAAQITLEKLADKVPENARIHQTLGKLLYKNGELSQALYHLERSQALAPEAKTGEFLQQLRKERELEATSKSYTSLNFSLVCDESFSEEWAQELLEHLEEAYDHIGSRLCFYPAQRSQVLVMQTEDFRNVHDLPEWAGGVYDGKIRLPVPGRSISPSYLRSAIRHEYTHHVVFLLSAGNCPIWLNEGLAQIFEFDSESEEYATEFARIDEALLNFADSIRNANEHKQVAALYKKAHHSALKLVDETGWHTITAILQKLALGHNFKKAANESAGYDIF